MQTVIVLMAGLLAGAAFAQGVLPATAADGKSYAVEKESPTVYIAVVEVADYKPGADPQPYWSEAQRHLLAKWGIYDAQLQAVEGHHWTLRLTTKADLPSTDLQEVLRAYLGKTLSLQPETQK